MKNILNSHEIEANEKKINQHKVTAWIFSNKVSLVLSWATLFVLLWVQESNAWFFGSLKAKKDVKQKVWQLTHEEEFKFWVAKKYNLSALASHNSNISRDSLYMRYLYGSNISQLPQITKIPDSLEINFKKNLDDLWKSKLKRYWKKNKVLSQFYYDKVEPFTTWKKTPEKSSLEKYRKDMRVAIDRVNDNISLKEVARVHVKKWNHALFESIIYSIKDKDLLAYNLTELFDSSDWKFNLDFFDFLLRNAWKEYVHLIPALWDRFLSFWPFQNTSYVVSPAGNSVRLDKLWKKRLIPDKMYDMRFTDHHEVAYYNSIYNIARLLDKLTKKQENALRKVLRDKRDFALDNITQYIAAAHNNPVAAQRWFKSWLDENCKKDVYFYVKPKFSWYAKRSKHNRKAIKK